MSFYNSFIGLNQLPVGAKKFMRNYSIMRNILAVSFGLAQTFLILYIIDALGFYRASLIISVMVGVQLLIDYPTGALGDRIGQRWVLSMAFVISSIGYFLLSFATMLNEFILVACFFGFANAQASGALQAWLDTNYKAIDSNVDTDRKNYGYSMTRIGSIDNALMGITFIVGGIFSTLISRSFVFQLQGVLILFSTVMVVILLREGLERQNGIEAEKQLAYFDFFKKGLKFVVSSKSVFFYIIGFSVFVTLWQVWGVLILFPIYFGYTGSDIGASVLRSFAFFSGVLLQIYLAKKTKDIDNHKLPMVILFQAIVLFLGIGILIYFRPLSNSLDILSSVMVLIIMTLAVSLPTPFINALSQRLMIDMIPSDVRNGVYSLIPTISGVMTVICLPLFGSLVETQGMISVLIGLLVIDLVAASLLYLALSRFILSYAVMQQNQEQPKMAV